MYIEQKHNEHKNASGTKRHSYERHPTAETGLYRND